MVETALRSEKRSKSTEERGGGGGLLVALGTKFDQGRGWLPNGSDLRANTPTHVERRGKRRTGLGTAAKMTLTPARNVGHIGHTMIY